VNDAPRFRTVDHFALWASLGASLYLMPFGALLVPALSIEQAILAATLAALLGGLLIASITAIAASSGRSTAELLGEPFGEVGRWPVAILLLARHALFTLFALVLIADSAELISERALDSGLRPIWVALFAAVGLTLVMMGTGRAAKIILRVGLALVLLVALAVSVSAYAEFEIPSYLRRPSVGGWPSFWQGMDLLLIFPLLWLPIVADFARFGTGRSAARGSFAGVFIATVWFGILGVLYLPATDRGDIPGFLVGMQLGLGAIALLLILQVDEVYANAFGAVPTFESLGVGAAARPAAAAVMIVMVPAAVILSLGDLEPYVLLTASVFVPAFAIVISRAIWPAPRPAVVAVVAWLVGFVVYQWISPAELGWWQDAFSASFEAVGVPFPLSEEITWLGAAIPSFVAAFTLDMMVPAVRRVVTGEGWQGATG
jgi:purine-cytosine permease-like protein